MRGSSRGPSPADLAIVIGVSPSMMKRTIAWGPKPSLLSRRSRCQSARERRGAGHELKLEFRMVGPAARSS